MAERGDSLPRCLERPPRLTICETRRAGYRAAAAVAPVAGPAHSDSTRPGPRKGSACQDDKDHTTYKRAELMALRHTLDRRTEQGVAETIRRSLPSHLSHVLPHHHARPVHTTDPHRPRTMMYPGLPERRTRLEDLTASSTAAQPDQNDTNQIISRAGPGRKARGNLSIQLLNIQSLLPKLADIRTDVVHSSPEMLCFTETNLKSSTPNRFVTIPGYTLLRQDRKIGRKNLEEALQYLSKNTYPPKKFKSKAHQTLI